MFRGTTPTLTFTLPFATDIIKDIYITFEQNGEEVLELTNEDVTLAGNTVTVELTQEQTLRFNSVHKVEMQIRFLTHDEKAFASHKIHSHVSDILKEGEI